MADGGAALQPAAATPYVFRGKTMFGNIPADVGIVAASRDAGRDEVAKLRSPFAAVMQMGHELLNGNSGSRVIIRIKTNMTGDVPEELRGASLVGGISGASVGLSVDPLLNAASVSELEATHFVCNKWFPYTWSVVLRVWQAKDSATFLYEFKRLPHGTECSSGACAVCAAPIFEVKSEPQLVAYPDGEGKLCLRCERRLAPTAPSDGDVHFYAFFHGKSRCQVVSPAKVDAIKLAGVVAAEEALKRAGKHGKTKVDAIAGLCHGLQQMVDGTYEGATDSKWFLMVGALDTLGGLPRDHVNGFLTIKYPSTATPVAFPEFGGAAATSSGTSSGSEDAEPVLVNKVVLCEGGMPIKAGIKAASQEEADSVVGRMSQVAGSIVATASVLLAKDERVAITLEPELPPGTPKQLEGVTYLYLGEDVRVPMRTTHEVLKSGLGDAPEHAQYQKPGMGKLVDKYQALPVWLDEYSPSVKIRPWLTPSGAFVYEAKRVTAAPKSKAMSEMD